MPGPRDGLWLVCLTLWSVSAIAQDVPPASEELLRYEPPSVDVVYPPEPGMPPPPPESEPAAPAPATEPQSTPPPAPPADTAPDLVLSASGDEPSTGGAPEFGARARVTRKRIPGAVKIENESARDLPGAFGDPLRILDALPGVVPIASGVPYVYARGAPPAAQGYVYDDIPLPQLFHVAFGPAVIHPRATGPVRFYAGVPPARYGRRSGGLLLAEGLTPKHAFGAELELRLIDMGAWVEAPLGTGDLMVSGRLGYPKLAILAAQGIGAMEPGTKLNYWDGQVRYAMPVGKHDRAEFVWIGSFDSVNLPGVSNNTRAGVSRLEFHRVETRLVHELPRGEVGAALRFGYDGSELGTALSVRSYTVGPRVFSKFRLGEHTVRVGGDLYTSVGKIVDAEGSLGSPEGDIEVSLPHIAEASARNQGGVWSEAQVITSERTRMELGLRFDYWSVESHINWAVDPRIRAMWDVTDELELHAAFGLGHQPAVFLLPVPGLTDVALDKGLTRSIQSEVGAAYSLPYEIELEVQGFLHHYDGILLPELVTDGAVEDDPPLSSALSYGVEVFLKRAQTERLSGWVSYTLGFATADSGPDVIGKFHPDFDVRHVLNTVAQWRIWRGLTLGGRMQLRSGRLIEQLNPRYEQRLPWFVRADARIGYKWRGRWADMLAYFEWLNMFVRREYLDADCVFGQCRATSAPPISIPNLGVRAEF